MKKVTGYIAALAFAGMLCGTPSAEVCQAAPPAGMPSCSLLAAAESSPAQALADDIAVSRLVFSQELRLLEAGQSVEDCLYGRKSFDDARRVLSACRQQGEGLCRELRAYQSQHPSELGRAALQLWDKRLVIFGKMEKLLAQGRVEPSALRVFQEQNGEITQEVAVRWLGVKGRWAQAGAKNAPNQQARQYYAWQMTAVPAQKQMCVFSQRLLELSADAAQGKAVSTAEAREIQGAISALGQLLGRQSVPSQLRNANRALIAEVSALGRLAEAMALLSQDRSSDAVSRLERCNKNLRRASLRFGQESIDALRSCKK